MIDWAARLKNLISHRRRRSDQNNLRCPFYNKMTTIVSRLPSLASVTSAPTPAIKLENIQYHADSGGFPGSIWP